MPQPFPHDRLLVECLCTDKFTTEGRISVPIPITNLLDVLAIPYRDSRVFDTHFGAAVRAFPHIGKIRRGDWVIPNSNKTTRNNVRRWQDPVVAADGLQLV